MSTNEPTPMTAASRRRIPPPPPRRSSPVPPPVNVPDDPKSETTADAPVGSSAQTCLESTLRVHPIDAPVGARHDPRSAYVERFWVSILGPSAVLLLRRMAARLDIHETGFEIDLIHLAQELGLGFRGGKNSPVSRTIDRLCRFGLAIRHDQDLAIHRHLPDLSSRQVSRLPPHLQQAHHAWSSNDGHDRAA